MKRNSFKTYIAALITGVALFTFFYTLQGAIYGTPGAPETGTGPFISTASVSAATSTPRGFTLPSQLSIPSIGVKAKVQHVGLTATGAMGIPTNYTDVAWYKHGTIPGEVGSAVIDGHVDNGLGLNGVFKKLHQVPIGEDVYVTDNEGKTAHFKVIDIQTYPYNDAPSEEIFGPTNKTLLRLITCGGKWVRDAKTYDTRVVVTAEYVKE